MKNLYILVNGVKPELAAKYTILYAKLCFEEFPCYAQFVAFEPNIVCLPVTKKRVALEFLELSNL
jgi:hypothetical protein